MSRRQLYVDRIEGAFQEYVAAEVAVELLEERLRVDPSYLRRRGVGNRIARELRNNLENTYWIRLFAAFEGGVRDAWQYKWNKATEPPIMDLINSVGGRRSIPGDLVVRVHTIREYRNSLIHAGATQAIPVKIGDCHQWLCEYFNWLPKDW